MFVPNIHDNNFQWHALVLGLSLPAGQDAHHVIGLVALDADSAVIKVGLHLLVSLPDCANL